MTLKVQILTQQSIIDQQTETIKTLNEKIDSLEAKIAELSIKKGSHNSSLAPSTDIFKKNQSLREKSTRQSGGQQGHQGSTLKMSETPNETIDLKSDYCNSCGGDLSQENFIFQSKRQVIELPPIAPIYKEFRQYSCQCSGCGHKQTAAFPTAVKAPIQYGKSVESLVSYLSVYQNLPYNRLKNLFSQVFSLPLSQGTINNILERVALECEVFYEEIKAELSNSTLVGSDETGVKVDGKKYWIWVWQNLKNTFISVSQSRGFDTVEKLFEQGFTNATMVSDRWAAQIKTSSKAKQICLAHLLRDLNYLQELEKNDFASEFKTLIESVFRFKRQQIIDNKAFERDDPRAISIESQLKLLLKQTIDPDKCPKTATFQLSMVKYRDYLLPCIYDLEVPPDNNASERAIRIIKVKQKVSGQFKSAQQIFCVIRSVIDTLIKRNLEVLPNLTQIIQG